MTTIEPYQVESEFDIYPFISASQKIAGSFQLITEVFDEMRRSLMKSLSGQVGLPKYTVLDYGFIGQEERHRVGNHLRCGPSCRDSGTDLRGGLGVYEQTFAEYWEDHRALMRYIEKGWTRAQCLDYLREYRSEQYRKEHGLNSRTKVLTLRMHCLKVAHAMAAVYTHTS